jgi:hypothetical protein
VLAEELVSFLVSRPFAFVFGCSHIAFTELSTGRKFFVYIIIYDVLKGSLIFRDLFSNGLLLISKYHDTMSEGTKCIGPLRKFVDLHIMFIRAFHIFRDYLFSKSLLLNLK